MTNSDARVWFVPGNQELSSYHLPIIPKESFGPVLEIFHSSTQSPNYHPSAYHAWQMSGLKSLQ